MDRLPIPTLGQKRRRKESPLRDGVRLESIHSVPPPRRYRGSRTSRRRVPIRGDVVTDQGHFFVVGRGSELGNEETPEDEIGDGSLEDSAETVESEGPPTDPEWESYVGMTVDFSEAVLEGDEADGISKSSKQYGVWMDEMIPRIYPYYLKLLRTTNDLKEMHNIEIEECICGGVQRQLSVTCISFQVLQNLSVCSCNAAVQLISRGFFPCAPLKPSLAVDINWLDFTSQHFLRSAPGVTSWTETMEAFLGRRHYYLANRDLDQASIRKRFGSAIRWYSYLCDFVQAKVCERVEGSLGDHSPLEPSRHLVRRCPLCFGGSKAHDGSSLCDVQVSLDACFTQKRTASGMIGKHDPKFFHPDTHWLTEKEVAEMANFVSLARNGESHPSSTVASRLPDEIIQECEESHVAANEQRRKASTEFFADTGIMALLCRHDRPLFVANMTSAGEKQHYALALLKRLFMELPDDWNVMLLYDIACVLERSCHKWNLLGPLLDRLSFAVSIFHAYGHEWACQLVYHPRKCPGCGLFDGEGCERFWSLLKFLISILRVSGYHQRLYTLDRRMHFLEEKSFPSLGEWIRRKWARCVAELSNAEQRLQVLGITEEVLRKEWKAQVETETQPLNRQSKKQEEKVLQHIVGTYDLLQSLKEEVKEVDAEIEDYTEDRDEMEISLEELVERKEELRKKVKKVDLDFYHQKMALGSKRAQLQKLIGSKFARLRIRASVEKNRLRKKLRERKFEMERLERAYYAASSHSQSGNQKIDNHILSAVRQREPTIIQSLNKYNGFVDAMENEVVGGAAPFQAMVPLRIMRERLWELDVDDVIWNDVGLGSDGEGDGDIPMWMKDSGTREGIQVMLLKDRCGEEKRMLIKESLGLQRFANQRWREVTEAAKVAQENGEMDMLFQLMQYQSRLLTCIIGWKRELVGVGRMGDERGWGPSEMEMIERQKEMVEGSIKEMQQNMEANTWEENADESAEESDKEDIVMKSLMDDVNQLFI